MILCKADSTADREKELAKGEREELMDQSLVIGVILVAVGLLLAVIPFFDSSFRERIKKNSLKWIRDHLT